MKRRRFFVLAALFSVAILFAISNAHAWSLKEAAAPYKGTTISIMINFHPSTDATKPLIKEFEEITGITVDQNYMKLQDLRPKMDVELASGAAPYDISWIGAGFTDRYVRAGWATPLEQFYNNPKLADPELDLDDFFPAYLLNQKASDGKVYGLPYTGEGLILYYRTDILEKAGFAGPPKTYDELEEICKKVNTPETPCFAVRASRGRGYNPFSYPLFLYGYGGKWFNDGWNPALDSPEAAAGLEEMVKLLTKYGPKGVANYTHYEMYTDFAQGKMVMFIDASVWVSKFNEPTKSNVVGKWASASLPAGPAGAFGGALSQGMMVPASSKNKEAAYLFMQWYTSKETQKKRALLKEIGSGDVTRMSVIELPEYKKQFSGNNWANATFTSVKDAVKFWVWDYLPEGQDLSEALSISVSKAIAGEKTPKDAMKDAQKDFIKILKKNKYLK